MNENPLQNNTRHADENALSRVLDKAVKDTAKTRDELEAEKIQIFHEVLDAVEKLQRPGATEQDRADALDIFTVLTKRMRIVEAKIVKMEDEKA